MEPQPQAPTHPPPPALMPEGGGRLTVVAWNNMADQLFRQLPVGFPSRKDLIQKAHEAFLKLVKSSDPSRQSLPMNMFLDNVEPYLDKIEKKDETLITEDYKKIQLLSHLDLAGPWTDPRTMPETKETIWYYLQQLTYIGFSVRQVESLLGPEAMDGLEQMAAQIGQAMAKKAQESGEQPKMPSMTSMMKMMMGAMGGGGGGMGAMGAMMAPPPQQRQQQPQRGRGRRRIQRRK